MKITIDTKEDSKEEIRKAIQLLSSLMEGESKINRDLFASSGSSGNAFASMFGDGEVKGKKESEDKPVDFSSFINLINNSEKEKKERDDVPRVIPY